MIIKRYKYDWYECEASVCSDAKIHNVSILIEMIEAMGGWVICDICNIGDVDFFVNDLCIN